MHGVFFLLFHPMWPVLKLLWATYPRDAWHSKLAGSLAEHVSNVAPLQSAVEWWSNSTPANALLNDDNSTKVEISWPLTARRLEERSTDWGPVINPVGTMVISLLVTYCIAVQYKPKVTERRPNFTVTAEFSLNGKGFRHRICGCCDDCQYFLHGCFLPGITLADHYAISGVNEFWPVVFISMGVLAATQILNACLGLAKIKVAESIEDESGNRIVISFYTDWLAEFVVSLFWAMWLKAQRQNLRQKLGGQKIDGMNDFLLMWCCTPCTIIQEARQVDAIQNVRVHCCCNLINLSEMGGVGQPVFVGAVPGQGQVIGGPPAIVQGTVVAGQQPIQATVVAAPTAATVMNSNAEPPTQSKQAW